MQLPRWRSPNRWPRRQTADLMITRTLTAIAAIGLFISPGLSRCSGWPQGHCSTSRRGSSTHIGLISFVSRRIPAPRPRDQFSTENGAFRGICLAHPAWIPNIRGYRGCAAISLRPDNLNELCYRRQVISDSWLTLRKSGLVCDISSISGEDHYES
ncbi:hypothetical protein BJX62DRAFT_81986 [Aspergillus germanicus]